MKVVDEEPIGNTGVEVSKRIDTSPLIAAKLQQQIPLNQPVPMSYFYKQSVQKRH